MIVKCNCCSPCNKLRKLKIKLLIYTPPKVSETRQFSLKVRILGGTPWWTLLKFLRDLSVTPLLDSADSLCEHYG